jgi:hypothetical protein
MVINRRFESGYLSQLPRQIFCLVTFIPCHHWVYRLLLLLILFLFFIVGGVHLGLKFWKVALYVFLEELASESEIFEHVVIAEHCIEVGNEIFSIEMHKVMVEVHLWQGLDVGVHVQWNVTNSGLIEQLHKEWILLKVSCALHEIVESQWTWVNSFLLKLRVEFFCELHWFVMDQRSEVSDKRSWAGLSGQTYRLYNFRYLIQFIHCD